LFDESYYEGLEGGILEAMGKLFSDNTHIYIYPSVQDGKLITLDDVSVKPEQKYLLKHLIKNGKMTSVENYNEAHLHLSSRQALAQIKAGEEAWKEAVPEDIKQLIIEGKFFGYTE